MTPVDAYEWTFLADTVMGGVSTGGIVLDAGGLRLTGTVSTENNGGFIQARTPLRDLPGAATGLRLRVRGNGERYFVHLRTSATRLPWQYYQASFETGADWAEVEIAFASFRRSGRLLPATIKPAAIRSVGLVAFGRDHAADVSLSHLDVF